MESNVAINGGGPLLDGGVVGGELVPEESPPHAPSIKNDAALAHRRCRIAGCLANMKAQLRVAGLDLGPSSSFDECS
jgi:hypothetical protein